MCGHFCIGFVDFMLKGKSLLDYTNLFPSNDYKKNNDYRNDYRNPNDCRKFEKPKTSYLFEKTLVFSIRLSKCKNKDEKIFKEEDSIEIWLKKT